MNRVEHPLCAHSREDISSQEIDVFGRGTTSQMWYGEIEGASGTSVSKAESKRYASERRNCLDLPTYTMHWRTFLYLPRLCDLQRITRPPRFEVCIYTNSLRL